MTAWWITGDTRDVTAHIPDGSVDLILTSPPFLALRSYLPSDHVDKHREIGSEATPAAFIDTLLDLTAEWRRVLAPHGTLCLELGDTYSGSGGAGGDYGPAGLRAEQPTFDGSAARTRSNRPGQYGTTTGPPRRVVTDAWPTDKSLTLIPESYRFALAYGRNPHTGTVSPAGRWRVRNVIRWVRPNPPVGALGDKFRPATSELVVACTARDRWFDLDAVRGEPNPNTHARTAKGVGSVERSGKSADRGGNWSSLPELEGSAGAPPLDWWHITPGGFSGAHYAVFPQELCVKPVEAMCPRRVCLRCGQPSRRIVARDYEGECTPAGNDLPFGMARNGSAVDRPYSGTTTGWSSCGCPGTDGLKLDGYHTGSGWRLGRVLDPFAGSGTVASVATGHSRDSISIDLDERNEHLARERVGMFMVEVTADGLADVLAPAPVEKAS